MWFDFMMAILWNWSEKLINFQQKRKEKFSVFTKLLRQKWKILWGFMLYHVNELCSTSSACCLSPQRKREKIIVLHNCGFQLPHLLENNNLHATMFPREFLSFFVYIIYCLNSTKRHWYDVLCKQVYWGRNDHDTP